MSVISVGPNLRPCVVEAKQRLAEGRDKLRRQHDAGSPGVQVCAHLTELLDKIILDLYEAALADLPADHAKVLREEVSLVAHGGYGRGDVAPFSDVDLMILHTPVVSDLVAHLAKRLTLDVFDAGLILGHSVRTVRQACALAADDMTTFTALAESRLLAGSESLFAKFITRFQRMTRWRWRRILRAIEKSRDQERAQFGETVYLLEPNIKRSRGALRDLQLLRWIGFTRYGVADPEGLALAGELEKEDHRALRDAREFLLRLRNEMHFFAGKASDLLDRGEQMRIAELFGHHAEGGLMPAELFMREYFRHTDEVSHLVSRFVAAAKPGAWLTGVLSRLMSHKMEGDFLVGPAHISATPRGLAKLHGNLDEILRLTDLANLCDKRIAPQTWDVVCRTAREIPDELSPVGQQRFLSLISQPARLGELLRNLHEAGLLEKVIPAFRHARSLVQFNDYHKYTVDEHCIRAVDRATDLLHAQNTLGQVYRGMPEKRTLHLALLIHDLGKGFVEDHSEVGLRIAQETGQRLHLPERETEALKLLVHKHLLMSHLAFRRDTSDDQLVLRFAVDVGSPEVLRMLFVLTACDIGAVGPGVWNDWKGEVLTDLYYRTMEHLAGESLSIKSEDRLQQRRGAIQACLASEENGQWFTHQIESLPHYYLYGTAPERIAAELRQLRRLNRGDATAWGRYLPESRAVEFTVGTYDDITPGVFHKLTGALSSKGLQILSAEINTLSDGLVFDRFRVVDPDFAGEPPPVRLESVNRALVDSLRSGNSDAPTFRRTWKPGQGRSRERLATLSTQVRIDNSTSERYTIIDVFAHDRMGLLYTITRTLFEMGLSVALAKIGTYLDQVVDVFYVTDQAGHKVWDEERWRQIRERLLEAIGALELT